MDVGDKQQVIKSHEQAMRERALLLDLHNRDAQGGGVLSAGILTAIGLAESETEQLLKDIEEEIHYAEEIRKADHEFDSELIRMSGFEW